ncbi:MAG: hypothetical protein EOO24_51530 [Comamonadaceae bacterium]|nr:MAG: hypothetical protein EOO24_51530 [Comamonadaceae bacterium]
MRQALMTAFLNQGLEPPEPAVEVLSSVTVGSLLRLDPGLVGAVRLEHAQDEVARGGMRRLPVGPPAAMPSLGLYTRRAAEAPPRLVQSLADALRRFGKQASGVRTGPAAGAR